MKLSTYQISTLALAVALAGVCIFHDVIWPCDITTEAANTSVQVQTVTYDSSKSRTVEKPLKPLAVVRPKTIEKAPEPLPAPSMGSLALGAVLGLDGVSVWVQGRRYVLADSCAYMETAYYRQTIADTSVSVTATVEDSIRNNRIVWRALELQNNRPTSVNNYTDIRPDRTQVFVGFRGGAFQLQADQWNYMLGVGGRVKFKRNWMVGLNYLQGPEKDIRAITADVDFLIRFNRLGERLRSNRLRRLSNRNQNKQ